MAAWAGHMANRALHLPSCVLGGIGLDTCRRRGIAVSVGVGDRERLATVVRPLREAAPSNISVSFQDLLRCHFGIFPEESGIAEDGLQVLRNLKTISLEVSPDRKISDHSPRTWCRCM